MTDRNNIFRVDFQMNFVSGWQWKDSIGPKKDRKVHLDMSWFQYISNVLRFKV